MVADARKPILAAWMGGQHGGGRHPDPEPGRHPHLHARRSRRCGRSCTWYPTPATWRSCTRRRATSRWRSPSTAADCADLFDIILMEGTRSSPRRCPRRCSRPTRSRSPSRTPPARPTRPSRSLAASATRWCSRCCRRRSRHKTDVGGVVLNLARRRGRPRRPSRRSSNGPRAARPDADVQGVTVQTMVTGRRRLRADRGRQKDPNFGAVIMVRHGRHGGRGVPRPGAGLAAAQRAPGAAHARVAPLVAAAPGLPRPARRQPRPADRDPDALLLPGGRLSRRSRRSTSIRCWSRQTTSWRSTPG